MSGLLLGLLLGFLSCGVTIYLFWRYVAPKILF